MSFQLTGQQLTARHIGCVLFRVIRMSNFDANALVPDANDYGNAGRAFMLGDKFQMLNCNITHGATILNTPAPSVANNDTNLVSDTTWTITANNGTALTPEFTTDLATGEPGFLIPHQILTPSPTLNGLREFWLEYKMLVKAHPGERVQSFHVILGSAMTFFDPRNGSV